MTETNHANEAAASSPDHSLQASALPDERGLQDIARNVLGYYPATMQAMAVEILRMRRDCPPTVEIEAMRAELANAEQRRIRMAARTEELICNRDAGKRKADTLGGDLNRIRSLVRAASDEQATFDAVQAELQRLRSELTQFRQAIGLLTTAKPDM